jgi:uncharacterized membrane-anchored protein
MKRLFFILTLMLCTSSVFAQTEEYSDEEIEAMQALFTDSIAGQEGSISLSSAHCVLNVPKGFMFLDKDQAKHLLVDYWDNPQEKVSDILGVLVKTNATIFYEVATAYVIEYEDAGYVSDEDADKIDYDDLLKSMQSDIIEENKNNPNGPKWTLLGWAWRPTYDKKNKVLAWAKHYQIAENGAETNEVINYDVRILGKAGFVVITAVAAPEAKDELLTDNSAIVGSIVYNSGYKYSDFNPKTDHVAEWTIGGLIAGKVLAKAGFWAVIAKFSKVIIIAIIGFFAAIRKRIARWFGYGNDDTIEKM